MPGGAVDVNVHKAGHKDRVGKIEGAGALFEAGARTNGKNATFFDQDGSMGNRLEWSDYGARGEKSTHDGIVRESG